MAKAEEKTATVKTETPAPAAKGPDKGGFYWAARASIREESAAVAALFQVEGQAREHPVLLGKVGHIEYQDRGNLSHR